MADKRLRLTRFKTPSTKHRKSSLLSRRVETTQKYSNRNAKQRKPKRTQNARFLREKPRDLRSLQELCLRKLVCERFSSLRNHTACTAVLQKTRAAASRIPRDTSSKRVRIIGAMKLKLPMILRTTRTEGWIKIQATAEASDKLNSTGDSTKLGRGARSRLFQRGKASAYFSQSRVLSHIRGQQKTSADFC